MTIRIRAAQARDVPRIVDLLIDDAPRRVMASPALWAVDGAARARVTDTLTSALAAGTPPFRERWLVAETGTRPVAVARTMLLPVPPIYAGAWGEPGLLLEDCALATDAPAGTADALLEAAEADLRAAGARLLLASSVAGGPWQAAHARHGYEPLTCYLTRELSGSAVHPGTVRAATDADIASIVARSAENRAVLAALDGFWTPHAEAGSRFEAWMRRSLTLTDRDMLVTGPDADLDGYVVAQPATRLHFPHAHPIARTGVIDDYFHRDFADPANLRGSGEGALDLLQAAERALADRGYRAAFVVCPAAWTSKRTLLEGAGYRTALAWWIKRATGPVTPSPARW